ncbi:MAG: rRNA maturation RNase YbeY [Oscillospiraceae bacterium]|nr:rRNA maturation RNase YbeY [Oscillospiraceae bacterium]
MRGVEIRRDKPGLGHPETETLVRRAVAAALRAQGVRVLFSVSVLLTDDAGIQAVNRAQRGIDRPTDVLSFPLNELTEGAFDPACCERDMETQRVLLGDMVLSLERCATQAAEYGHGFDREVSYLTVHSMLHLLGYDHLDEGERKRRMRAREELILRTLNL